MKSLTFLWLVLLPLFLEAQSWQNICSPGITLYGDPNNNLSSFRLDSKEVVPGNPTDSIFKSYLTLRKLSATQVCYDTAFGSVLGEKVYKKANGTFIFFNHLGDSVFLITDAVLFQSWRMISLPNSDYLLATVSEIKNDSVCGLPDQVKVITIQAKNAATQNIYHIFNNKQIVLSKHYGLTHVFDLVLFPTDTVPKILIGKSTPQIGLQDFSIQDTYNYNVGDEFHTHYYWGGSLGLRDTKTINIILSKNVSLTGDTVIYSKERCILEFNVPPPYYSTKHDTINDTIILHNNLFYFSFDKQPLEFSPKPSNYCDLYQKFSKSFNDRPKKRFYIDYVNHSSSSNCWVYNINYPFYDYADGLGQTRYFNQYLYYTEPPPQWITITQDWQIVYFRKGSETWGTPLATDCATLVGINEKLDAIIPGITISPNPIISHAEIKVTGINQGKSIEIILFDCFGREVYRKVSDSNPYIFNREGLPKGFYIIKVIGNSNKLNITSKIILY
ncbi:MAG: T9SS type A sorting domain-containing protein [Bacteroidales bacterium]|nr:T9SS type A sorting domain-containing protein [Bacteroidales bacterium]